MNAKYASLGILIGAGAAFVVGNFSQFTGLWLTGALMDTLGFSASKAGLILTLEYLGIALSTIVLSPVIGRVPLRKLAIAGASGALIFHGSSVFVENYFGLLSLRFLAGFCAGAAFAASSAIVASLSNPERAFGQIQMVFAAIGAVALYTTGYITSSFGHRGVFVLLAIMCAVMIPVMIMLLPKATGGSNVSDPQRVQGFPNLMGAGGGVVLAMLLFNICEGSSFIFVERVGVAVGYHQEELSWVFGTGGIIGVLGGSLAAWMNIRFGRMLPVVLGLGLNALVIISIYAIETKTFFLGLFYLVEILWFFCLPYIFGLSAALDPGGKLSAVVSGTMLLGIAGGPVIGGMVADNWGLHSIGWLGCFSCLAALIVMVLIIRSMDGNSAVTEPALDR